MLEIEDLYWNFCGFRFKRMEGRIPNVLQLLDAANSGDQSALKELNMSEGIQYTAPESFQPFEQPNEVRDDLIDLAYFLQL